MAQTADHLDSAEKALAKEFSDYLASVSREIINPISENISRHQSDVEKMLSKVADARSEVESEFERQRQYLASVRQKIEEIVKESELKLAKLHSLHQSLLESARQKIVAEVKVVSDDISGTVQRIREENQKTRQAITEHHDFLQHLLEKNRTSTAQIITDGKDALVRTFKAHEEILDQASIRLVREFRDIAEDLKLTTGNLMVVHDETRNRLFTEFSEYRELNRKQVDALYQSLRGEIASRIDQKSKDVVDGISAEIVARFVKEVASLHATVSAGFEKTDTTAKQQSDRLDSTVSKLVADVRQGLADSNAVSSIQTQRAFSTIKHLLIGLMLLVAGATVLVLIFRV